MLSLGQIAIAAGQVPDKFNKIAILARMAIKVIRLGFEPKTHSLEGCCSIQLSYRTGPYLLFGGSETHSLEGCCLVGGCQDSESGCKGNKFFLICKKFSLQEAWNVRCGLGLILFCYHLSCYFDASHQAESNQSEDHCAPDVRVCHWGISVYSCFQCGFCVGNHGFGSLDVNA